MERNRRHYFWSDLHICAPRQFLLSKCGPGKWKDWVFVPHSFIWDCETAPSNHGEPHQSNGRFQRAAPWVDCWVLLWERHPSILLSVPALRTVRREHVTPHTYLCNDNLCTISILKVVVLLQSFHLLKAKLCDVTRNQSKPGVMWSKPNLYERTRTKRERQSEEREIEGQRKKSLVCILM